jgi:hypothetical protein
MAAAATAVTTTTATTSTGPSHAELTAEALRLGFTQADILRVRVGDLGQLIEKRRRQQPPLPPPTQPHQQPYASHHATFQQPPQPVQLPQPLFSQREVMTPSELGLGGWSAMPTDKAFYTHSLPPVAEEAGAGGATATAPTQPAESKDATAFMNMLLKPVDVRECVSERGLEQLADHLVSVLAVATDIQEAAKGKWSLVSDERLHAVLAVDERQDIAAMIEVDRNNLLMIKRHVNTILDGLDQLARERSQIETTYRTRYGSAGLPLAEKLKTRTTAIMVVRRAMSAQVDTLDIPSASIPSSRLFEATKPL